MSRKINANFMLCNPLCYTEVPTQVLFDVCSLNNNLLNVQFVPSTVSGIVWPANCNSLFIFEGP